MNAPPPTPPPADRTLDQLLMDYLLWDDPTAAVGLRNFRSRNRRDLP